MSTESFPIAVKNSPRSHHLFVIYLYNFVECLTGNPTYPTPTPSVATLKSVADALVTANAKAKNGGSIAVADRNAKRVEAELLVDQLVTYVRVNVRVQAADPAAATAMILSSGLAIRKQTKPSKPPLAARYGPFSGEVLLVARSLDKSAVYQWEYSLDQATWTSVPQTLKASTKVAGLTPGQVYAFRFRAQTRKGMGDYSQVVTLLAH